MRLTKEHRESLELAVGRYAEHLPEAAAWLEGRGIDLDLARSAGLGVVRNPLPQHAQYVGRLAIPYLTDHGPVNMTFRCLSFHNCKEVGGHGKYEKMKGWGSNLYGVRSLSRAEDWIAVTEGEIDCLTLDCVGIPAVGVPGAENWQPHWYNVLEDFSRVYVFTDGDDAGEGMWERFSHELKGSALRVRLPAGEDVNSIYVKHGDKPLWNGIRD